MTSKVCRLRSSCTKVVSLCIFLFRQTFWRSAFRRGYNEIPTTKSTQCESDFVTLYKKLYIINNKNTLSKYKLTHYQQSSANYVRRISCKIISCRAITHYLIAKLLFVELGMQLFCTWCKFNFRMSMPNQQRIYLDTLYQATASCSVCLQIFRIDYLRL